MHIPTVTSNAAILLQAHPLATSSLAFRLILERLGGRSRFALSGDPALLHRFNDLAPAERAAIGILDGHFNFGVDEQLAEPGLYITFLRDPAEAAIAFFYMVLSSTSHYLNPMLTGKNWSLADLAAAKRPELDNPMVRRLNPAPPPGVRMPFGTVTRGMLEMAKRNLQERYLFGIAERFDDSLLLIARVMGWDDMHYIGPNAGLPPELSAVDRADPDAVRRIREINDLDQELYEFGLDLFQRRVEAACPNLANEAVAFREENVRRATSAVGGVPVDLGPVREGPATRDILWIASYPRSGNSWLRFLLDAYFFPPARRLGDVGRLSLELDWWVQAAGAAGLPESWIVQAAEYLRDKHPRPKGCPSGPVFKTHFLRDDRHPLMARSKAAVYLYRDPRDVLLSGLNYSGLTSDTPLVGDRDYALAFIEAGGDPGWIGSGYGGWAEHVRSWLEAPAFSTLPVSYEDLKSDTPGQLARILEFLEVPVDRARIDLAVDRCSIDRLRNLEVATRAVESVPDLRNKDKFFFHKGLSGQSLAHLGADVEEAFATAFGPAMARWGYPGS